MVSKMEGKESVFGQNKFVEEDNNKFLKFKKEDGNRIKIKFLETEPIVAMNKFNTEQYTFEVLNLDNDKVMSHSITSRRYMRSLEDYYPLEGKVFTIQREGEGVDTIYILSYLGE